MRVKMSKQEVWDKLTKPTRKCILFCVPTHFTRNKTDDGWVVEGTDIPYNPATHVDREIWIYDDDWSPCDE